jgi:hypothetical protein
LGGCARGNPAEYRKLRVLVVQRVKRRLPQSKRGAGADARAAEDGRICHPCS